MKYLDYPELTQLVLQTHGLEVGDCQLELKLEAYSCKLAGADKKLCKSLESQFVGSDSLSHSPQLAAASPVGPLSEPGSRRVLYNLICTMNASSPDYDFSGTSPMQLMRESNFQDAVRKVDGFLQPVYMQLDDQGFRSKLWNTIDSVVGARDCEIYSYVPDAEDDEHPFSSAGKLWTFNYFFYNKRMKKVIFFSCAAKSRLSEIFDSDGGMNDDDCLIEDYHENYLPYIDAQFAMDTM